MTARFQMGVRIKVYLLRFLRKKWRTKILIRNEIQEDDQNLRGTTTFLIAKLLPRMIVILILQTKVGKTTKSLVIVLKENLLRKSSKETEMMFGKTLC